MWVSWVLLNLSLISPISAGTNYKDDSFNLMPFFTASCYSGYGDDSKVCLHSKQCVACTRVITSEGSRYIIEAHIHIELLVDELC